jgi:hypothetical protein
MAPEYAMRGIFSAKSDVYSFGVLTLEVVSGVKISSTNHIMEFENLIAHVSISFSESAKSTQFKLLKFQNLNFRSHSFFFSGMEPMEGREGEGFGGL